MTFVQEHPGVVILGLCLLAGLALSAVGALRVIRAVSGLKKRVASYRDLPILKDLERAEVRLAAVERRAASVPSLLARSRAALLEIEAARAKIIVVKTTLETLLRLSGLVVKGH